MAHRVVISSTLPDARARGLLKIIRANHAALRVQEVHNARSYAIDTDLSKEELRKVGAVLSNALTEQFSIGRVQVPRGSSWAIEVGFLPGVTDNVGRTAQSSIEDGIGKTFSSGENVYSSLYVFLAGKLSEKDVRSIAGDLHNPLIERATITKVGSRTSFPVIVPKVKLAAASKVLEVDLEVNVEELTAIGRKGIADEAGARRGPLALSLAYMKVIRDHFRKLGRKPTDIELESLAQTWSEHCKHTIFADPLDEVHEGIYKRYIKGATQKIRKQKGKRDFCVSVFTDNSGAIEFDDEYLVTHKVETHNSPSALDPYGGAITGIVGVNRDCLGFGMGAKPIANVYGFCVAAPTDKTQLFRDPPPSKASGGQVKRQPLLSARRILEGVVRGINAGGNQSGIPTPLGFVATDPRYRGKPLVFAGTVGLIPRLRQGFGGRSRKRLDEKKAEAGDYIVMLGGRVGLDGIHGATFSSEALSSGSPATAVQIGDPITQKKLSDLLIREARDRFLYNSITDNGAGGLSCSVAEMAKECGGCDVDLDLVPVKYPGLEPWQIWISESQERMTLAVPKGKWTEFKKLCDHRDVEATRIGVFTSSPRCIVRSGGKVVMDLGMDFLHDGRPVHTQKSAKPKPVRPARVPRPAKGQLTRSFLRVLSSPNIGSTAFISQQYDHEVQATSVTKPLQGRGRVNADAGVLRPIATSNRGIVLSDGYCPWYSDLDTYAMAAAAIDTAVRNAVCAGASLDRLAILDNFCWSSSNTPERLYELKRAGKACYDVAIGYGTPFISGKDSMFNDFRGFDAKDKPIHVAAPPTLLISAIGVMRDISLAQTIDLKQEGDVLYLLGETNDETGASEYANTLKVTGETVPKVQVKKNLKTYGALEQAIKEKTIASAVSVGRGGLAAALAKTCVAGQLGASVALSKLPGNAKRADAILFSESQGRIVVSVAPEKVKRFETLMRGVTCTRIGSIGGKRLHIAVGKEKLSFPVSKLTDAYRAPYKKWYL